MRSPIRLTRFKNGVLALSAILAAFAASSAWANEIVVKSVSLRSSDWELTLRFQDQESVSNACDYSVRRFEYIPSLETLMVDLVHPDKCMIDHYGRRQGILKWELPASLREQARLKLIVNGRDLGTLYITREAIAFANGFSD